MVCLPAPQFLFSLLFLCLSSCVSPRNEDTRWLHFPGGEGIGDGYRIVFVSGDEEYRSEESLPMLARLLSEHHGFETVVLFSQDPETGMVDPDNLSNIPGIKQIKDADLLVMQWRFRELPDEDMKVVLDFIESGKPIIGIRTSTHAFNYIKNPSSPYAKWSWKSKEPSGGFGREIFGETWIAHHGNHGKQATRGVIAKANSMHPVLRGVKDVFGPTDVYAIRKLPDDALILLNGAVLEGMSSSSAILESPKNNPMHPVAWIRNRPVSQEGTQRVFVTTMGAAQDWSSEDLRRLFMNASAWCLRLEEDIPVTGLAAEMIGPWAPTSFGFGGYREGYYPEDYRDGSPWESD